jgi:hypothetical protein
MERDQLLEAYFLSLSEKEKLAFSIAESMLKIQLKDTIGFQTFLKNQTAEPDAKKRKL